MLISKSEILNKFESQISKFKTFHCSLFSLKEEKDKKGTL